MTAPLTCYAPGCDTVTDPADTPRWRRCTVHMNNPWAGQVICHRCLTADWTMPVGPATPLAWRCLTCHISLRLTEPKAVAS